VRGIIPPPLPQPGEGGGRGEVRGIIPPSSLTAWERKGDRGEGEGVPA